MNVIGISGLDNGIRFKKREFPDLSVRQYRIAQGYDSAVALVSSCGVQAMHWITVTQTHRWHAHRAFVRDWSALLGTIQIASGSNRRTFSNSCGNLERQCRSHWENAVDAKLAL